MADPRDLKFFPSAVRLVEHYLSKRIETGNEGFIKDIKLYEDEPWLLPHIKNDLFNENEWFYFVQRTLKAGKTPKRTVPGRGGSNGGTWTSTSSKEAILKDLDGKKVVIGHKAELSYYKHVEGHTKGDATGWCMTEYSLASEDEAEFQEIVLCYIRVKKNVKKNKVESVSWQSSTNTVLAPLEDIITMVDPSDLRFLPTGLKLLEHYLSKRVETGKDGFIKDIKLYEDEPWHLLHVKNNQFIEKEWFYFVERPCGSRKKRTVAGGGGSKGGTWTSTSSHKKILDNNNVVVGYEQELSYYKHVKGQKKGDTTGWCMTEYWLASDQNFVLCNIRVKKNVVKQYQCQTETNNNIVEQPPLDNNTVLNALVTGAGGEGEQQNMDVDDYRFMFDLELLDFTDQEQPLMLPQDSIPPLQGQDLDQHMEEYANKLEEDMLKDEEDDDAKASQQQHPHIPLPLVIFNLAEQRQEERMLNTFSEMQNNLYFQDSYPAAEMYPWDNMMSNNNTNRLVFNTHGYQMQQPPLTNDDSSCFGATQEQRQKRRKQC